MVLFINVLDDRGACVEPADIIRLVGLLMLTRIIVLVDSEHQVIP
jgi:hypothetical protein